MLVRSAILNVMMIAAEKAGRKLIRDFGEVEQLQVSRKGPADFVSSADNRAEKAIRQELQKARPDFSFLMEETGIIEGEDKDRRFIVDPLDGTTNFLHGLPHWAVSIAYEENGQVISGCVYDPIKDEMFWAEKGKGAFINDRRIRVSGRTRMADCIFATGIPFLGLDGHEKFLSQLAKIMAKSAGVRRWGAASLDLCYVAAGRVDGFWETGLHAWDVAAGQLIVKEAGGFVTDSQNRAFTLAAKDIVAANDKTHTNLLALLRSAK